MTPAACCCVWPCCYQGSLGLQLLHLLSLASLQGPPGMRGSPGPPGPIVSISGSLTCLRGFQRGSDTHTPFCCFVPKKLGRAGRESFHFPMRASLETGLLALVPWNRPALPASLLRPGPQGHIFTSTLLPSLFYTSPGCLGSQAGVWSSGQNSSCPYKGQVS